MDPVTALGLACNVIQLVEAGYKGVALCWRIYTAGEDIEASKLRDTCDNLSRGYKRLQDLLLNVPSNSQLDDGDLLDLCARCQSSSLDLVHELNAIALPAKSTTFKIIGKALKSSIKASKIERIAAHFSTLRETLDTRVLISTHALLRESGLDQKALHLMLDERSCEILQAIRAGRTEVACIVSQGLLDYQNSNITSHDATRQHIDQARGDLSAVIVQDGTATRSEITSLATKFDTYNLHSRSSHNELLKSILKTLSYPEMFMRPESISPAHRGTCQWIYEQNAFSEWLRNDDHLFWIQGKAGAGKSTLMSFLVEESKHEEGPIWKGLCDWSRSQSFETLYYFFWENGTELQRSIEGLLRCLLWQLLSSLRSSPDTLDVLLSVRELSSLGEDSTNLHINKLNRIFKTVVRRLDLECCVFLDGLDEVCDDQEVLEMIDSLTTSRNVKICVSSRSSAAFEAHFEDHHKLRMHELTWSAIEVYVRDKLNQNKRIRQLSDVVKIQTLVVQITHQAQGVFLWVKLVVKDLLKGLRNDDDLAMLQKRVARMPEEINSLYEIMWRRNNADHEIYQDEAALYFGLMLRNSAWEHARSLLVFSLARDDELRRNSFAAMRDASSAWLGFDIDEEQVSRRIQTCTAGMLEVQFASLFETNMQEQRVDHMANTIVRACCARVSFIHKTAAAFLQSSSLMRHLISYYDHDVDHTNRLLESDILCWGLMLMTQNASLAYVLPDLGDKASTLPWIEVLGSLILRATQQPNFKGKGCLARYSAANEIFCGRQACPSNTTCIGRHVNSDIVPWAFNRGLGNIVRVIIERQGYPRELFTNLLWMYNPYNPVSPSSMEYLLNHGARLCAKFPVHPDKVTRYFVDPSLTLLTYLVGSIIAALRWHSVHESSILATAQLLLQTRSGQLPRGLPLFSLVEHDSLWIICDWSLYDLATMGFLHTRPNQDNWSAELKRFVTSLAAVCDMRPKRAYAFRYGSTIWPINETDSVRVFENLMGKGGWFVWARAPGRIDHGGGIDNFEVIREIMQREMPFETLHDAYRYARWTDEQLREYEVPLRLADKNESSILDNGGGTVVTTEVRLSV